jgi:hypothetical protein
MAAKIWINGTYVCTIGVAKDGYYFAFISQVNQQIGHHRVFGPLNFSCHGREYVEDGLLKYVWKKFTMKAGDSIRIEITDAEDFSEPERKFFASSGFPLDMHDNGYIEG